MFDFFAREKMRNQLKQSVLQDVEKLCGTMERLCDSAVSSVNSSIASLGDSLSSSLTERFDELDEQARQAQRQERRRQTALETILDNQGKILEKLARIEQLAQEETPPPLEPLMALAENLALAYLARPANSESSILYGKLIDLLACFSLSPVIDAGSPFDPERHEACAALCNLTRPEDSVLEIVRPGFLLKGKVLRYATVVVNRYDAKPEPLKSRASSGAPTLLRNQYAAWEGKLYELEEEAL
ncbi:MAG: nucleotide exchange factor GrpE [Synergistaceae bacterium]|jgi:molecular chaperone GrpE (heat shock protein)|nr:nucleotide exchange factor GrpE [Synergistaceae bacterium]